MKEKNYSRRKKDIFSFAQELDIISEKIIMLCELTKKVNQIPLKGDN